MRRGPDAMRRLRQTRKQNRPPRSHASPCPALRRLGIKRLATWLRNHSVHGADQLAETAIQAVDRQHTSLPGEKQVVAGPARPARRQCGRAASEWRRTSSRSICCGCRGRNARTRRKSGPHPKVGALGRIVLDGELWTVLEALGPHRLPTLADVDPYGETLLRGKAADRMVRALEGSDRAAQPGVEKPSAASPLLGASLAEFLGGIAVIIVMTAITWLIHRRRQGVRRAPCSTARKRTVTRSCTSLPGGRAPSSGATGCPARRR
jgi:hypothetical protein